MGTQPLIGITAGVKISNPASEHKLANYLHAIHASGGIDCLLFTTQSENALIFKKLDGLLLTGGGDIPPYFWGESIECKSHPKDDERARFEIPLVKKFLNTGKPILGVCLGLQMINVALGGSLMIDLKDPLGNVHRKKSDGSSSYHNINVLEGTKTSNVLPRHLTVNSRHHQAVKKMGHGLKVSAVSDDDVIEAIESVDAQWVIGVQWHPEDLFQEDPYQQKIFQKFIEECRK